MTRRVRSTRRRTAFAVTTGIEAASPEIQKDPRAPKAWRPEESVEADRAHLDLLYRQRLQYQTAADPEDLM
jgi:hypothetical protein